jgi:hypothetical protein
MMAESNQDSRKFFRELINRAITDEGSEIALRDVMSAVMKGAPKESLLKMALFVAEDIWEDADRQKVQEN